MPDLLCLTVRFLQPYGHGRGDDGEPQWPPSPLRLFQALVAASASHWNERMELTCAVPALRWMESLGQPAIAAAEGVAAASGTLFYVPDNSADLVVPAWKRGELTRAVKRTEKICRPTHVNGDAVHYLFQIRESPCPHLTTLKAAARSITHLGWGIDMVAADASLISEAEAARLSGERWRPAPSGSAPLRVPIQGTLEALMKKHSDFLNRLGPDGFRPVPPLTAFRVVNYRRESEPLARPCIAFRLLDPDTGKPQTYAATDPVKVAGMIRGAVHQVARNAERDPKWIGEFVCGHHDGPDSFPRFSYLPLPSIQPVVGVGRISRVVIAEPIGSDGREIDWLKPRLSGVVANNEQDRHALLVPLPRDDFVLKQYLRSSPTWTTVTPVALPGSDDGMASKTAKLLEKMLRHAGYSSDAVEDIEYHRVPFRRGAEDAKRYRPRGDHYLSNCTMYHMRIRWKNPLCGPIGLGGGRHCGLGVFAIAEE